MEPKDWIAVAQVYATLANASAAKAGSYEGHFTQDRERFRKESWLYSYTAKKALIAAGLEDVEL